MLTTSDATPDTTAPQVAEAAAHAGLCDGSFKALRAASNVVLADSGSRIVARVGQRQTSDTVAEALSSAAAVAATGAPVLPPLKPRLWRLADGRPVTFWPMGEPPGEVTPQDLARLAARLHMCELPDSLPRWDPARRTARKQQQLADMAADSTLPKNYVSKLLERWQRCVHMMNGIITDDPPVIVHGDLHPGNVVRWHGELVLCDLDGLCRGPREADIAKLMFHFDRFREAGACTEFLAAYPHPFASETVETLRTVLEISACIWLASLWAERPDSRKELQRRMGSLDDPTVRWAPV